MITLNVPLGSENSVKLALTADNAPILNYSEITRVQVVTPTLTIDSNTSSAMFDLTQVDCVILKFGGSGLPLGLVPASLRIFTPLYMPDGLFWCFFQMNVFDGGVI